MTCDFLTILFVGMIIGAILSLRRMWLDAKARKIEQRRRLYQQHIQKIVDSFDDGRMERVSNIEKYFKERRSRDKEKFMTPDLD